MQCLISDRIVLIFQCHSLYMVCMCGLYDEEINKIATLYEYSQSKLLHTTRDSSQFQWITTESYRKYLDDVLHPI